MTRPRSALERALLIGVVVGALDLAIARVFGDEPIASALPGAVAIGIAIVAVDAGIRWLNRE